MKFALKTLVAAAAFAAAGVASAATVAPGGSLGGGLIFESGSGKLEFSGACWKPWTWVRSRSPKSRR